MKVKGDRLSWGQGGEELRTRGCPERGVGYSEWMEEVFGDEGLGPVPVALTVLPVHSQA